MLNSSFYVVLGFAASAVLLGWAYFQRYEISRPPIGVIGLGDVVVMIGAIVLLPYLYLAFPLWIVGGSSPWGFRVSFTSRRSRSYKPAGRYGSPSWRSWGPTSGPSSSSGP